MGPGRILVLPEPQFPSLEPESVISLEARVCRVPWGMGICRQDVFAERGKQPFPQELTGMPPSVANASEAEHRLFQYLFDDYNEIIRPVANVSHPVVIQFEVSMSQLVKVVSARATRCGRGVLRSLPEVGLISIIHLSSSIALSRMK